MSSTVRASRRVARARTWHRAGVGIALNFMLCALPFCMSIAPAMWHALNFVVAR